MKSNQAITTDKQRGFSLTEIIIGVAIGGLLVSGVATLVFQSKNVTSSTKDRMQGIMQVENAGYWMSRDIQMSENLTLGDDAGFPLLLTWQDTDQNEYQVTYSLAEGSISRSLMKNGVGPTQNVIARDIAMAPSLTSLSDTGGLIVFNVAFTSENAEVSRTYQIKPRLSLNK